MKKEVSKNATLRDIFLNIFTFVMLYISAFNVGGLLFQIINHFIPDAVNNQRIYWSDQSGFKMFLASVVVVFPVYVYFALKLGKEQRIVPSLRRATSFKLLTYATLTITGIIIISSVVRLVFGFIDGDLPIRIVLKILVVVGIALAVFGYYLWNIKQLKTKESVAVRPVGLTVFLYTILLGVALSVGVSLTIIESPSESRNRRLDQQRADVMSNLEYSVQQYYFDNGTLPQTLEDLTSSKSGMKLVDSQIKDPITGRAIGYHIDGEMEYSLCAVFLQDNREKKDYQSEQWPHGIGETCFVRTVRNSPDSYPRVPMGRTEVSVPIKAQEGL